MELLLPILTEDNKILYSIFTFQYGATSTTASEASEIITKEFTFQYGATST